MNKLIAGISAAALLGSLAMAGSAAAGTAPSGTGYASTTLTPKGTLYKEVTTSGSLNIKAGVTPADDVIVAKPTVSQAIGYPDYMTFQPNNKKTPICTAITEENANFPTEQAIALCPDSVVGSGRSDLYLAGNKNALVTDSVTINFNGGFDKQGRPLQVIHGYSASTNTGIWIGAVQKNNALVMDIPRLTADSAVPFFESDLPGPLGQDPNYVQMSCPGPDWTSTTTFTIAYRDEAGQLIDPEETTSAPYTQPCSGKAGKAKFGKVKIKAKGKVKANKKGKFKVTVDNSNGTATAKGVKLTAKGAAKGSAKGKNIAPGKKKTFTMKAKVKGKKGKKVTVKVKVTANNGNAKVGKAKVKLK